MAIRVSNITVIDDSRNIVNVDNIGIGTTGSSGTLQIGAGTSAFVVTGVGSVGIGTTNPSGLLHLASTGSARLYIQGDTDNVTESDGSYIIFGIDGSRDNSAIWAGNLDGTNDNSLNIANTGSVGGGIRFATTTASGTGTDAFANALERMRIHPTGEVGINTTVLTGTASQRLQVTGGAYVSGSVGIGTTNPGAKLHVVGDVLVTGVSTFTGNVLVSGIATVSNGPLIIGSGTSTGTASQSLQVSGGAYVSGLVGIGTTNPLGTLQVGSGTSTFIVTSIGSVGIGTTNPTAKFEPVDTAATPSAAPVIFIQRPNNVTPASIAPTNADLRIKSHSSNFKIYAEDQNANPLMILTGSGNLGIGTTNPTSLLTVIGNASVSGLTTTTNLYVAGVSTFTGNVLVSGFSTVSKAAIFSSDVNVSGATTVGTALSVVGPTKLNTHLAVTGVSTFSGDVLVSGIATVSNGPLIIGAASSTGTASQRLQVTGGAYVSGNLGIGTTNPGANTQVSIAGTLGISEVGGSGARTLLSATSAGFVLNHNDNSNVDFRVLSTSKLQYQYSPNFWTIPAGVPFLVGAATSTGTATQPLQVTGGAYVSGNLGIGTTNPGAKVEISTGDNWNFPEIALRRTASNISQARFITLPLGGDTAFNSTTLYGEIPTIGVNYSSAPGAASTSVGLNASLYLATPNSLQFYTNNLLRTTIDISGNLGIGTTIPTAALTIGSVGIASDGRSQIFLNGIISNRIDFSAAGVAAPAVVGTSGTTRSAGTKIVLFPTTTNDYAIGVESSYIWSSVPAAATGWKWYAGTVGIATLSGTGGLTLSGGISGTTGTFSSQIQSTQANNTATGGGQIYLNGAAGNRIDFSAAGVAAPAFTTRSAGTRIVLTPAVDASNVDYGFGIESGALWSSVQSASASFKWYAGTVGIATIGGNGTLSLTNAITATAGDFTGVGIASDGNAQIYLNGATSNRIDFAATGTGTPAAVGTSGTTRSAGTKIVLYPGSATPTATDYAFGIASNTLWSSVDGSASSFRWYAGTVGIATLSGTGGLTLSGGLTVGSNSNIVGDFSNATLTARTYFISKTTNGFTAVGAIPNGTSTTSSLVAFNNSTPTNASYCGPVIDTTGAYLRSSRVGTGAFLPLYIETTDTTRVAITTTGNVGIGITNPGSSLQVAGPSAGVRITNNTGLVGDLSSTGWLISQASSISAIPPASALTISNGSVTALTALTTGSVGINTTDAGSELDVQGNIFIRDTTGSATFTNPGNLSIKDTTSNPFISFHAAAGARQSYIQSTNSTGFFIVEEDALPLVLRTKLTSPIQFETNTTRRVAISTGGETEFFKGISVVAGIATIPTVSVTATTASTSTTTGALIVAGGVGVAASVYVGGDVGYRRSAATVLTATYTGTPANYATIVATGMVGLVTFTTTGIGATINVTGMLPGQVLELFVTNPTTAKVLTIQYSGTAIAGVGIASASPAQGASFAANGTRLYRFIAATNNPAVVAGDIKVVGTT